MPVARAVEGERGADFAWDSMVWEDSPELRGVSRGAKDRARVVRSDVDRGPDPTKILENLLVAV